MGYVSFLFFNFTVIFWNLLLLKGGGKVGCVAFLLKNHFLLVTFFDRL